MWLLDARTFGRTGHVQGARRPSPPTPPQSHLPLLLSLSLLFTPPALANTNTPPLPDDSGNPLVQRLLSQSLDHKSERQRELLDNYTRKNFCGYMAFELRRANAVGITPETQAQLKAWLDANQDKCPKDGN